MKRDFRLTDKYMLDVKHFPIRAIFNSIPDNSFVKTIMPLGEGIGFGVEYGACIFPSDLDEYDIATIGTFDGVQFGLHNGEDVIIDYQVFYYYLNKVCIAYLEDFPQDNAIIKDILIKVKRRFQL